MVLKNLICRVWQVALLLGFGSLQANVTDTNKTFFVPRPPGREQFVNHAAFFRMCRKADNPEQERIGMSLQVTGFFRQSLKEDRLGGYFGIGGRSDLHYGNSSTLVDRAKIDLPSDYLIHGAHLFTVPYNKTTGELYLKPSAQPAVGGNIGLAHVPAQELFYYSSPLATGVQSTTVGNPAGNGPFGWAGVQTSFYREDLDAFRSSSNGKVIGDLSLRPESRAYGVRLGGYLNVPRVGFLRCNVPVLRVENRLGLKFANRGDAIDEFLQGIYSQEYLPLPSSTAYYDDERAAAATPLYRTVYNVYKDPTRAQANAQEPLKKLKVAPDWVKTDFGLGDIEITFGSRIVDSAAHDCAVFATLVCPTSKAPTGEYLFEPLNGNGQHFEFSGGIEGTMDLCCYEGFSVEGFYNFGIGYIFKADQTRTLSLFLDSKIQFPWQHYCLIGKVGSPGALMPLANLTTLQVEVRPGIKAEGFLGLGFNVQQLALDLGCGFWAKEADKVRLKDQWQDSTYAMVNSTGYCSFEPLTLAKDSPHTFGTTNNSTINADEFDLASAATPTQLSLSLWASLSYALNDFKIPCLVSLGGAYEFGHDAAAMTNWSIWGKVAVTF